MTSEQGSSSDDKDKGAAKPAKSYKDYLSYLKDSKNSEISAWIGKSSDILQEVIKFGKLRKESEDQGVIAPASVIKGGALNKALEITMLDFVKAKLECEDPIELGQKYGSRLSRLNDEYHHQQLLNPKVNIIGFIKDKDTRAERLLFARTDEQAGSEVLVVDPTSGVVLEVLRTTPSTSCFISLVRAI